jgi:hypothetical protein
MTIQLKLDGQVEQRTRIKLLWFWIVSAWTRKAYHLDRTFEIAPNLEYQSVINTPVGEFLLKAGVNGASISFNGFVVFEWNPSSTSYQVAAFKVQPIKGLIVIGSGSVETIAG